MTAAARLVLDDCREAVEELWNDPTGSLWRRRYLACVALLRAVGHVLGNVDVQISTKHKAAIVAWWQQQNGTKPKPEIFWLFIDDERNLFLKTYGPVAGQNVTIFVGGGRDPEYTYVMKDGPFKGADPRNLINEAINWWEGELDAIDQDIAKR